PPRQRAVAGLALVGPGEEDGLAVGTPRRRGAEAESLAAGRGIDLDGLTDRALGCRKYLGLDNAAGRRGVRIGLRPSQHAASTGQRRKRRPGGQDSLLGGGGN